MRIGRVSILVAAGGAAALSIAAWAGAPEATAKVDAGPVGERIVARAQVVASGGVRRVFAASDGRIARVLVRTGDAIEAGQRLAEFEAGGQTQLVESPQRGVVVARNAEVGDYAFAAARGPAEPLFELADPAQTELRVEVEEADAPRLAVGQPAQIMRAGGAGALRLAGEVARVSARLERRSIGADDARVRADGLVRVAAVTWRDKAPEWPLGTRAEAIIQVRRREAAARVPRAAVSVRDGRSVVDEPHWFWSREVPVEIVSADDAYAEVRGIALGTEVILPVRSREGDEARALTGW